MPPHRPQVTMVLRQHSHICRAFVLIAGVSALLASSVTVASAGSDLDNDGRDDLVVGVPDEDVAQVDSAGSINIFEGGAGGITARGDKLFTQASLGGTVEALDRFGNAITYGDFNGDGFDDVAVGAPTEDFGGDRDAGVVHIIYGSENGVRARNNQLVSQVGKMAGKNEAGDFFGTDLASGDIDGDGFDDLVVGVSGENVAGKIGAGAIIVAYGGRNGIKTRGSQSLSQKGRVPGVAEDYDAFGVAVAVGDFNNDGFDDVAVGAPGEGVAGQANAGNVTVLYGRSAGLNRDGRSFAQTGLVPGGNEAGDDFGNALTAGDFNGDGFDDVAVGVPGEDVGAAVDAGAVVLLLGTPAGITDAGAQFITQESGPLGASEEGDRFGRVLAAGNFNGDRLGDNSLDDLAVGSPNEGIGAFVDVGRVAVLPGSAGGLDPASATNITQGPLPKAKNENDDYLGASLRTGDFDGNNVDDLVIGSPREDVGTKRNSGVIYVAYGSTSDGLDVSGASRIHQGTRNVNGRAEAQDLFGTGL